MAAEIDLNRLQIFREVVMSGSFSKAAARLRQPKSRVSRNIAALEEELGVQLIYRTTRQFQLTQAGTELFQRALPALNEIRDALERVSSGAEEVSGLLRVTVPEDIGVQLMGAICNEFMQNHPKVRIDLHVGNRMVDLVKESFDVALRVGHAKDSSMIQKRVGRVTLIFVASPGLKARAGGLTRLEDAGAVPFLAFSPADPGRHVIKVSNGRETRSLKFTPSFSTNNFFVLKAMAIQGGGLTQLPHVLARDAIASGELVQVFKDWEPDGVPVQIMIPQQREIPSRVRRFIEFLTEKMAQRL